MERTFSEFMLSDYAQPSGAATNPEFEQISGGIGWVTKCQDCHMRDVTGYGCNKQNIPFNCPGNFPEAHDTENKEEKHCPESGIKLMLMKKNNS